MNRAILFILSFLVITPNVVLARVDFLQKYERGKIMLRRKLYFDAIKEFHVAVTKTEKGRRHFGAHYYLARAYYWLPDIQKAMKVIQKAKNLAKNDAQRNAYKKLLAQIKNLYSSILFVPEVDPEEVGKLQIVITPKSAFSHAHKRRYFSIFSKKLTRQGGILLNNRPLYVPKGDYIIKLKKPQCLKYGLLQSGKLINEFSVEDDTTKISVQEKRSCGCLGGQKIYKDGSRLYCSCPPHMGWDKKKKRCDLVKRINPWPWVAIVGGVVIVSGTTTLIVYLNTRGPSYDRQIGGKDSKPGINDLMIWTKKTQ